MLQCNYVLFSFSLVAMLTKDREYTCLSPGPAPGIDPDPGLIIYIDPFRIYTCINQGLAGMLKVNNPVGSNQHSLFCC